MTEKVLIHGAEIAPIEIREDTQNHLYRLLMPAKDAATFISKGASFILDLMLRSKMTAVTDRQATWLNCELKENAILCDILHKRIGSSFPADPESFEGNCSNFAPEKVRRTWIDGLICSHQNRDPENSKWGGSARITFKLISRSGEITWLTIVGAPSGLKEWEDMALFLGALHYQGFINFSDRQVQDILDAADASVADQLEFQPKDMTIKEYVQELFRIIDISLNPNI